mgnify:CR=1 FL=1
MSNYDKIFEVLSEWYTKKQIDAIWEILKMFDKESI